MEKLVEKIKKQDRVTLFLGAVFVFEILLLFYYNLFHLKDVIDSDFAMILRHVIEMADNRTFFLKGWEYTTTGEFDCPAFTAIFFYMISKNINLSYALSNIIDICIWAWVINSLLKRMGMDLQFRLLGLCFIFATYSMSGLRYTFMLFFNGGQYAYKALIPLLLILIITESRDRLFKMPNIAFLILYFLLLFLTAVSSAFYVPVSSLFPIGVCTLAFLSRNRFKEKKKYIYTLAGISILVIAGGFLINSRLGVDSTSYELHGEQQIVKRTMNVIVDFFDLFVPVSAMEGDASIAPFSANGIIQVLCMGMACLYIYFGARSLRKMFGANMRVWRDEDRELLIGEFIESLLISVFIWNFVILLLTTQSTPRYHIIGAIPLILCSVYNLRKWFMEGNFLIFLSKKRSMFMMTVIFMVYGIYSFFAAREVHFHELDERRALMDAIIGFMDENDTKTMFSDDFSLVETLRLVGGDKTFVLYDPMQGGVFHNKDYYRYNCDRASFSDRSLIVMSVENSNRDAEYFPPYVVEDYRLAGEVYGYRFFLSEKCPMDGMAGFPILDHSVDLPVTPGYVSEGKIDGEGAVSSDLPAVLVTSPVLCSDGKRNYSARIFYERGKDAELFAELKEGDKVIVSKRLDEESGSSLIDIPEGQGDYVLLVRSEGTGPVRIRKIEYDVRK